MSDDKTEEPSQHKLQEAKKKGQYAKSQDLVTAAVLAGGVVTIGATSRAVIASSIELVNNAANGMVDAATQFDTAWLALSGPALGLAQSVALLFGVAMALGALTSLVQSGFLITAEPMMPQFERVNPLSGIKRMFSKRGIMDNAKMLFKGTVMIIVGIFALRAELYGLSFLTGEQNPLELFLPVATRIGWKLVITAVIMGVLDALYQSYQFKNQMRMSKQEIKDEYKQLEGDPHVKMAQRRFRRQMAKRNRLSDVKEARVVVTNPTHYAVALRYKDGNDIPRVVAKGKDHRAETIKKIARKHKVQVVESPPLARSLFSLVNVGDAIPPSLYLATAEVLVMVKKLEQRMG